MYPEYKPPKTWKDGSSGHACIAYKGLASYFFSRENPTTKQLLNCKPGESVSFDDVHWGKERVVTLYHLKDESWTFGAKYPDDVKEHVEKLFTPCEGKYFKEYLKQAIKLKYYDDHLVIQSVPYNSKKWKSFRNAETSTTTIYLHHSSYAELKLHCEAQNKFILGRTGSPKEQFPYETQFPNGKWELTHDDYDNDIGLVAVHLSYYSKVQFLLAGCENMIYNPQSVTFVDQYPEKKESDI